MHKLKNGSQVWRNRWTRKVFKYVGISLSVVLILFLGLGRSPAWADTPLHYTELEFEPLPAIEIPEYTQFELDNGLRVYLLEDHELPLVGGSAMFHTGDRFEPIDKTGLASITGEVMRSGGTLAHSADDLNQILEQRAASVETGIGTVSGTASFNALTEDLEDVFGLFAEVLRQPAFPQDKLDLAKSQREGMIARRNDDPDDIASREFRKLIYGAESPYARTMEYATLNNVSREDVAQFYADYFHPNNMLLGIIGDFDTAEMRSLIEQEFGDWQPVSEEQFKHELPAVEQAHKGGVFLVEQPQLTQSYIQIGHLAGQLDSPDFAALSVMNEVLNGFSGRLFNEVRSRQGLAYSVYAFWSARFDYPGIFIGGGHTQSPRTVPFIESVQDEIAKLRQTPIAEEELAQAKESVLNAFVFNFEDPSQTLSRVLRYDYYDYPADFIFQYQQGIEATTIADVQRVAETYLNPEDMVTLVVGNSTEIEPELSSLDPNIQVTQIDVSIPDAQNS